MRVRARKSAGNCERRKRKRVEPTRLTAATIGKLKVKQCARDRKLAARAPT